MMNIKQWIVGLLGYEVQPTNSPGAKPTVIAAEHMTRHYLFADGHEIVKRYQRGDMVALSELTDDKVATEYARAPLISVHDTED